MALGLFNDPTTQTLRTALTGLQMRQQAIANNIANVDTPNYKAQKVSFEEALQAKLAAPATPQPQVLRLGLDTTDARHIPLQPVVKSNSAAPITQLSDDGTLRNDGNNVDIERQMTQLAETQINYNALGQMVGGKLVQLRTAINEGRR